MPLTPMRSCALFVLMKFLHRGGAFGAGLLGPSMVGLSVGWIGIDGCFYVNVVSYLAVIAVLLRIHIPKQSFDATKVTVVQSLLDGIGYVRRHHAIATLLIVSAIFNIFGRSYIILMPVFAKEVLALGAAGLKPGF